MHTGYYPLFVSLDGRVCLVVGGGNVGERKIRTLLRYGASVRVAARELGEWLEGQCKQGRVLHVGGRYERSQLLGADLVFAATSDAALNRQVAADARECGVWCNMATEPELGTFIVPAVFEQGPLAVAVSTGGLSPAVARRIKETLAGVFGPEWAGFLELMGLLREIIQSKGLSSAENQRIFKEVAALPIPEWIARGDHDEALRAVHTVCGPWISSEELNHLWKDIWKPSF